VYHVHLPDGRTVEIDADEEAVFRAVPSRASLMGER
jgi:hypothetical protein